jgi:hypothetical protein
MREITGIELGPNCCVLVRAGRDASRPTVAAARAVTPAEWSDDHDTLVDLLRSARRTNRLSSHAHVVMWGLPDLNASRDLSQVPDLGPLVAAGFQIDSMISPLEALADLVRARNGAMGQGQAVAALSINHHGVAIVIVADGKVIASRVFDWPLGRPFSGSRSEILERYLLVSQLAPELKHLIDLVKPVHGVDVTSVLACGNLPNLRSLSMLLIEEMDIEVETLDSTDLLDPRSGARFVDIVPALQLAARATLQHVAPIAFGGDDRSGSNMLQDPREQAVMPPPRPEPRRSPSAWLTAVAALVLCATWSVLEVSGSSPVTPVLNGGVQSILASLPAIPDLPAEATMGRIEPPQSLLAARSSRLAPTGADTATSHTPAAATVPKPTDSEQRAASSGQRPAPPRVDGIMIAGDRRFAIVDGNVVSIGDFVGPYTVVRIEREGVVLKRPPGGELRIPVRKR